MRYLVLSDIHANIDALESVLADADRHRADQVLVLGDLVGYCADPNGVIATLRSLSPLVALRGNHDKAAAGLDDAEGFNIAARESARWTAASLTDEHRAYLASLPRGPLLVDDAIECCHGTPFNEDAYVLDEMDALYAVQSSRSALCLFGHTHHAMALTSDGPVLDYRPVKAGEIIALRAGERHLINVGSVGQPRDGDPRAAYGIVDLERGEVCAYRVDYPIERAQARILDAGLPETLALRLRAGR